MTQHFDQVTDSVGSCGAFSLNLSGSLFDEGVIWLSSSTSLIVSTTQGVYIGTHSVELLVTLTDYPLLDDVVGRRIPFEVDIQSECIYHELMKPTEYLFGFYQFN